MLGMLSFDNINNDREAGECFLNVLYNDVQSTRLLKKKPNIGNFFLVFSQFSKINNSRSMMNFWTQDPSLESPEHALSNDKIIF